MFGLGWRRFFLEEVGGIGVKKAWMDEKASARNVGMARI